MKYSLKLLSEKLRESGGSFFGEAERAKRDLLRAASMMELKMSPSLIEYADTLLFLAAYCGEASTVAMVKKEMKRLADFLRINKKKVQTVIKNTGLPFGEIETKFSHEFLHWIKTNKDLELHLHEVGETGVKLNDVARMKLPSSEREVTSASYSQDELLEVLLIPGKQKLNFILNLFDEFGDQPLVKDYLFEALDVFVNVQPKSHVISRLYNKLNFRSDFYHQEILKKFDHLLLLNTALPEPKKFNGAEKRQCIDAILNSMLLAVRETDPATFMDENSLRLYELERGISIAIYGMTSARQLPYESYVGFTLFKNGYPAAYGGGWVFGTRSLFGINIFEAFRGGESGYIMCQLLRVYRQAFGVEYFEVEPYQYGADNPDGIKSGAFWFYYRYGFRPLDKALHKLADTEYEKIRSKKGYRSSERTLIRFTESNIALNLGKGIPMAVADFTKKITTLIAKKYKGERSEALRVCKQRLLSKFADMKIEVPSHNIVFDEIALFTEAFNIQDKTKLTLLAEMIASKPIDLYRYQSLLLAFFA